MPRTVRPRRLAPLVALAVLAAAPAAADAATITVSGGELTYLAAPGERNFMTYGAGDAPGSVRIGDLGAAGIAFPADRCAQRSDMVDCSGVTAVKADLGDGNDNADKGTGAPIAFPVELHGGPGDDLLEAFEYSDAPSRMFGGDGEDVLAGFGGADELHGGAGDDKLTGSGGADALYGDDGADVLDGDLFEAPAPDVIDGGAGVDRVAGFTRQSGNTPITVTVDGAADDGRAGEGDRVSGVEQMTSHVSGTFVFGDTDDVLDVYANLDLGPSTIRTNGGTDAIRGGSAAETIDAGAGDDRVDGGFGDDTITGGPGRDRISADRGDSQCGLFESCAMPQGNDTVLARDGEADSIDCGVGTDTAVVDKADTVAPSCERVETGAAPAGSPAGGGGGGGGKDATDGPGAGVGGKATARLVLTGKRRGRVVVAKGTLARAFAGARVTLRLTSGKRTVRTARATVDRAGRFTARLRTGKTRGLRLSAVVAATSTTERVAAKPIRVR